MDKIVNKTLDILLKGGTILYPTDTIWGIGCDATNEAAVDSVFKIKKRKDKKSMLVLVSNIDMLRTYIQEIPSMALELLKISTNPITIIYPNARNLASNLIPEDGSVGIRICNTAFCQKLITRFQKPIVSTSANLSGEQPPIQSSDINPYIISQVDLYLSDLDHKQSQYLKPSPIIKLGVDNSIEIIRT